VQAYATVTDLAANNDPFWSPPFVPGSLASTWTVPAVAAARGREGARFTSDLYLAAPWSSGGPIPVTIEFLPRGGGSPLTATTSLLPGTARVIEDVVTALFPAAVPVPGAGALFLDAASPIETFAVTRSDSASGPASQDLSAVRAGDDVTPSSPAVFTGLAESTEARSNLVLVNRGAGPATVALSLYAEDGARGTLTVPLASGEVKQLNSVISLFGPTPSSAAALLVAPLFGSIVATAMRVDNRSSDPSGLTPIAAPALAALPASPEPQR
jgi:hypothetical protein